MNEKEFYIYLGNANKDRIRTRFKYLYFILVILVALAPIGGTSESLNNIHMLSFRLDYLLHALVFIPLYPLWRWGWPHHNAWMVLFAGLLLAIVIEAVQIYIPYRAYNINDLLANAAGVLLGVILFFLLNNIGFQQSTPKKASDATST